jgi:hypothetical protein
MFGRIDVLPDPRITHSWRTAVVWRHPQVLHELAELFDALLERIGHVPEPPDDRSDVPLQVHARYTRIEILAAFGSGAVVSATALGGTNCAT